MDMNNYKYGELNHHYFNNLSSAEQRIYKKVVNDLMARKNKIALSQRINSRVLKAITFENPQLFFVNLKELSCLSDGISNIYLPKYLLDKAQTEQIEKSIRSMLSSFRTDDEERTIRNVHNYLVRNIKYDYSDTTRVDLFNHSLVNVIAKKMGVCEGISLAFQYILQLLDIECVSIEGELEGGAHAWNIVSVDGYNYHIDVTSDMGATQKGYKKPSYFCYLITDKEIAVSHSFSENFNCIQTKDNPFYKTQRVFTNRNELRYYLSTISKSTRTFYFKYLGRDLTNNEMFNYVISNTPRSLLKMNWSYIVDDTNTLFCFNR